MAEDRGLGELLNQGREQEEEYHWTAAKNLYGKALSTALQSNDLLKAGEIREHMGLCCHRAAMQAETPEEFESRMHEAAETYGGAAELLDNLEGLEGRARSHHCRAMAAYMNSKLPIEPQAKIRWLDECWKMEKEALKLYDGAGDPQRIGRACNGLVTCLADRLELEWDTQTRKYIAEEALSYGERAIQIFSETGDEDGLARAYCMTGTHYYRSLFLIKSPQRREEFLQKLLKYSQRAVSLSEKVGDLLLLGRSEGQLGLAADISEGPEASLKHYENMLEQGMRTRDHWLMATASYGIAYVMLWRTRREEDPDKVRGGSEECEKHGGNAIRHYSLISNDQGIAWTYVWGYTENRWRLTDVETNLENRRRLLEEAVEFGRRSLTHAQRSGSTDATMWALHSLSKVLYSLAIVETDVEERRRLLMEALKHREQNIAGVQQIEPFHYYNLGVYHRYLASIQSEIARMERGEEEREGFLRKAVTNIEAGIRLCLASPFFESRSIHPQLCAALGGYYGEFGEILDQLYSITGEDGVLGRLVEVLQGAVEMYSRAEMPSRVAESYWRMAQTYDELGKRVEASRNFEFASEKYQLAAAKMPQIKDFFLDYAAYMRAWSEIEKARHHHEREKYGLSKECYQIAANSLRSSRIWGYLAPNYSAWAILEQAEDLSRGEKTQESILAFQQAAALFRKAKGSLQTELSRIESSDEREKAIELSNASDLRSRYCLARINVEEARIYDREGDRISSAEKYASAAEAIEKIVGATESESERDEMRPIIYLCGAWQRMALAEGQASPKLFLEASELFQRARDSSVRERAGLNALGNSHFCQALAAGIEFENTKDTAHFTRAKRYMESAASYYLKAGYRTALTWVEATERLFDAYVYTDAAEREIDPEKKTKYYLMAERVLQLSAQLYEKAGHRAKKDEVSGILEMVRGKRELAVSLAEVLRTPSIVSSTAVFTTPTQARETAVGLEKFERANIQATLVTYAKDVDLGENVDLEIELINAGKAPAMLMKVEEAVPEGFELVEKPQAYSVGDHFLNLRGKRLEPLNAETIRLVLRPSEKGSFQLRPRITYLDDTGQYRSHEPEPATLSVKEAVVEVRFEPNRIPTGYRDLDNLLYGGLPEAYAVVLTSLSCDERELLLRRFLENGAREWVTFYLSGDVARVLDLVEGHPSTFHAFVCNPQADLIAPDRENISKIRGVEDLSAINISLTSAIRAIEGEEGRRRIICIDIMSDVLLHHHALTSRKWLSDIIPRLKAKGFTILATLNPYMHSREEARIITDIFDGQIDIYEGEVQGRTRRFLTVKKLYRQKYMEKELLLDRNKLLTP